MNINDISQLQTNTPFPITAPVDDTSNPAGIPSSGSDVRAFTPPPVTDYVDKAPKLDDEDYWNSLNAKVEPQEDYSPTYTPQEDVKRYNQSGQFNPLQNNEEVASSNQGVWSKLGNATAKFGVGAVTSFAETLMSIPDLLHGISTGSVNNFYKNPIAQSLDDFQDNMENKFVNYYSQYEQDHPFLSAIPFHQGSANFYFDKIFKGSGLVVGTLAGAFVENAAIAALTGGVGEIGVEGAIADNVGANLTRWFGRRSLQVSKIATDGTKFSQYLKEAEVTGDLLKDANKLEQYAAGTKVLSNVQYGLTVASSSNMMAAQGARQTYKAIKNDLTKQFFKEHGYAPTSDDDLSQIERNSVDAANVGYGLNFALFAIQNAVAFPNAMKGFNTARAGLKEGLAATTADQVGEIGLASKEIKTVADIDALKLTPESTKNMILRKWVKPTSIFTQGGVMALSHGVEAGVKDYYTPEDVHQTKDLLSSTMKGLRDSFGSTSGLESFLMGAITGLFLGPAEHFVSDKMAERQGALNPEKAAQTALGALRENSITGIFHDNYKGAVDAITYARELKDAARSGDIFKYKNLQSDQFAKMVLTGIRSNRFDVVREQIAMLKELPQAELDKVMSTPLDSQASLSDKHAYIDQLLNKADQIKDHQEAIGKVFRNPYRYLPNAKDEDGKEMTQHYLAYEGAKDDIIRNQFSIKDQEGRLKEMDASLRKINPNLSTDLVKRLSSEEGLKSLQDEYEQRSQELLTERDELGRGPADDATLERRKEIREEKAAIDGHIITIDDFLEGVNKGTVNLHDQANMFQQISNFEMNGRNYKATAQDVDFDKIYGDNEGVGGILDMGRSIDLIDRNIHQTRDLIKSLYTDKGFKDWMGVKLLEQKVLALGKEAQKQAEVPTISVGDKTYEFGRTYTLKEGLEVPKVEEGTKTGKPKWWTKDFWGGSGAKKEFDSEEDAQKAAKDDTEEFNKAIKTVKVVSKVLDKNGNISVETPDGKVYHIDPALLENHTTMETPDEIVNSQKRYDLNKMFKQHMEALEKGGFFSVGSLIGGAAIDSDVAKEQDKRVNGDLKKAPLVFGATITPNKDTNPREYVANAQLFFSNLNEIMKDMQKAKSGRKTSKLQMIFVHSDNAQALGLGDLEWNGRKGSIIDYLNEGTDAKSVKEAGDENVASYDQKNPNERTIATIVVERTAKGSFHYINAKGERVKEITNPHDLVINLMPTAYTDSVLTGNSRFRGDVTPEQAQLYLNAYRAKRDVILANTDGEKPPMFDFTASAGRPMRTKDPNNTTQWKQNPVTVSLIDREDLSDLGLVKVSTSKAGVTHMGSDVHVPPGGVVLQKGSRLVYLNNRKINDSEVEKLFEILKSFAKNMAGTHSIMYNSKDEEQRKAKQGFNDELTRLTNYLQGSIFYGRKTEGQDTGVPNPHQLFIQGEYITLGRNEAGRPYKFPFTIESFNDEALAGSLKEALKDLYTNANSKLLESNDPFNELYVDRKENGETEIKSRQWNSYQHYLLSDRYDLDGKQGTAERSVEDIPFTTSVNPKEEGKSNFHGQYAALSEIDQATGKSRWLFDNVELDKEKGAPTPSTNESVLTHPSLSKMLGRDGVDLNFRFTKEGEGKYAINPEDLKNAFANFMHSDAQDILTHMMIQSGFLKEENSKEAAALKKGLDFLLQTSIAAIEANKPELIKNPINAATDAAVDATVAASEVNKGTKQDLKQSIRSLVDTDEVYKSWSNKRDGTDKAIFDGQVNYAIEQIFGGDISKWTRNSLEEFLSAQKIFANKDLREKVLNTILNGEAPKPRRGGAGAAQRLRMVRPGERSWELHDLEKSEAWFYANMPFSGRRMSNLIACTGGGFAFGQYIANHAEWYENAKKGTIEHEAFEGIWASFTRSDERRRMMAEFRNRSGSFEHHEDGRTINYKDATDHELKERLAEELGHYVLDGKFYEAPKKERSTNFIVRMFQDFMDFVKSIRNGSIKKYFDKINTGYYKNMPRINDYTGSGEYNRVRQENRVKIGGLSTTDSYAVVKGVTSRMVQELFNTSRSLIEFDTKRVKTEKLFDRVFRMMRSDFLNVDANGKELSVEESSPHTLQSQYEDGLIDKETYSKYVSLWENLRDNWDTKDEKGNKGGVVAAVKEYLKTFGIRHEGEDSAANEEARTSEFIKDVFTVDNDKSMSASMKLLFATLVEQEYKMVPNEEGVPVKTPVEIVDQATNMPMPINFSKTTGFVRSNLKDCNTLQEKVAKLQEMAADNPNYLKLLARLGFDEHGNRKLDLDHQKLQAMFNNTFGKQRPDANALMVQTDGTTTMYAQNLGKTVQLQINAWLDALKLDAGTPGSPIQESKVEGEEGNYEFGNAAFKDEAGKYKLDSTDPVKKLNAQIEFLNSIGIDFNKEMVEKLSTEKEAGKKESDRDTFNTVVRAMIDYLPTKQNILEISGSGLGEAGRFKTLAELYLKSLGIADSTFYNIESKQQSQDVGHNFISTIANDINNSSTKQELMATLPHMLSDFRKDSVYLDKLLFNGDKRIAARQLSLNYLQGIIYKDNTKQNVTLASMSHPQRVMAEINANLSKLYYVLVPADSKTEWALTMQHVISYQEFLGADGKNVNDKIYDTFNTYYQTERKIALESGKDGKPNPKYKSLMYDIAGSYDKADLDKDALIKHIEDKANNLIDYLVKSGTITTDKNGYYSIENFNSDFASSEDLKVGKKTAKFTKEALQTLFKFTETNYMINNVEMHKLFFGDIDKIKDPLKRYKSFMSPRESSIYDDPDFNKGLNDNLNSVITGKHLELDPDGKEDKYVHDKLQLKQGDYGYSNYSDNIRTVTFKDQDVVENSIVDDKGIKTGDKELDIKIRRAYEKVNPTDGSGMITLLAHREVMYKRGQLTKDHDMMYDYLLANDRKLMFEDGVLQNTDPTAKNYYRPELQKYDEWRVGKGYKGDATLDVLKPIYSGVDQGGNLLLDKYSLAPLSYALTRKSPLKQFFLHMAGEGIHYAVADSGRKIGKDGLHEIYNADGSINKEAPAENTKNTLDFKYFGIQTETRGRHHHNSFGTQMSTEVMLNSMDKSVPTDASEESKKNWNKLSVAEKTKASEKYARLRRNYDVLKAMQANGYDSLKRRFGIEEDMENEIYHIPAAHMPAVEKLLKEELLRRDASQNLKDGISFNKETGEWNIPLEAMSNYKQIKQILFSYVEKEIAKPKMNGGAKIMVPGTLIGNVDGKSVKVVTGSDGKPRLVSDGLKFYEATYDANGKRTSVGRMEVMISSDIPDQMRAHESGRWTNATDEEIMNHLNSTKEGKRILEGIGFRIPTQEMNSLEAFTIKGFVPSYLGDTVIVPEAITTKAGSDFDVDKLQTYLKNIYMDKDGNAKLVPYYGTGEKAIQKFRDLAKEILGNKLERSATIGDLMKKFNSDDSIEMPDEEISDEEMGELTEGSLDRIEKTAQKMYKDSLQNEYTDSLGSVILDPTNFERLIKPNNADLLKDVAHTLEELAPNEFTADKTGSVLDREFMSQARHAFITGKDGVSIAANNQKNHSLNQLANVVIDNQLADRLIDLDKKFFGNGNILLPHQRSRVDYEWKRQFNQFGQRVLVKVPIEGGRWLPTFSAIRDSKGNVISDNLSQGIDGYVDVAKGAWIMNIIQHPMMSSTFFTMMKFGVDPETAALFINQPIVREFVKLLAKDGSEFMLKNVDSDERKALYDMFPLEYIRGKSSKERGKWAQDVQSAISNREVQGFDPETLTKDLKNNIKNYYAGDKLSKERNLDQHLILQEFMKYTVISSHLFNMQESLTWDTKSMAEPNLQDRKLALLTKAREHSMISDIDDILRANHLEALMHHVGYMSDAINQSFFKIGQKIGDGLDAWSPRKYIKQVLSKFPSRIGSDDYQRVAQAAEEHFISFLVQNNIENEINNKVFSVSSEGKVFSDRIKELLIGELIKRVNPKTGKEETISTSIARRVKDLRKELKKAENSDIAQNDFVKNLVIKTNKNKVDVKNVFLATKPNDSFGVDAMAGAMREFRDSTIGMQYDDLYHDILVAAFIQSGLSASDLSFSKYMPSEDYAKIVGPAIDKLKDTQELQARYASSDDFFRNKWRDDKIVPQEKERYNRETDLDTNEITLGKSKHRVSADIRNAFRDLREDPTAPWSDAFAPRARTTINDYLPFSAKDMKVGDYTHFTRKKEDIVGNELKIANHPDVNLIIHEDNKGWHIVKENGSEIASGETKEEVMEKAAHSIHNNTNDSKSFLKLTKKAEDEDGNVIKDPNDVITYYQPVGKDYIPFKIARDSAHAQYQFITLETENSSSIENNSRGDLNKGDYGYENPAGPTYFLKRVHDDSGNPIMMDGGYIYVPISPRGNGRLAEEHYPDNRPSVIKNGGYQLPMNGEIPESAIANKLIELINHRDDQKNLNAVQVLTDEFGNKIGTIAEDGTVTYLDNSQESSTFVDKPVIVDNRTPEDFGYVRPTAPTHEPLPEEWKKTGRTQDFYPIEGNGKRSEDPIQGYPLTFAGHPDTRMYVHKRVEGDWIVMDDHTGTQVGSGGRTIKDAVRNATEVINANLGHTILDHLKLTKKIEPEEGTEDSCPF